MTVFLMDVLWRVYQPKLQMEPEHMACDLANQLKMPVRVVYETDK